MKKKDLGRIALATLILACLKSAVQIPLPPIINWFSSLIITAGIVCGIAWFIKKDEASDEV